MPGRRKHVALSETSRSSPSTDSDDKPFELDSGTDLTELDCPPPPQNAGKNSRLPRCQAGSRQPWTQKPGKGLKVSTMELVHGTRYKDPADDTDEDLSKVPEDYGKSKNNKKLKTRLQDCWARSVYTPGVRE
jgi:hypothetical protein